MIKDLRFEEYFLFTQHSLTTFDKCPLKFKKKYLENLKWESFPDPEIKRRMQLGNDFHLLAHRYFLGIDTGLNEASLDYKDLEKWMNNLKASFKMQSGANYLPEYKLRMVTDGLRLEANLDLIVIKEDSLEIWDWKTHTDGGKNSTKKESAEAKRLRESLQTVVYLFVLKELAYRVTGKEIPCNKIKMIYWRPDPPKVLVDITYSDEMHKAFNDVLVNKINNVLQYDYSSFDKEMYQKHCKYCEFNWFCNNERIDFNSMQEDEEFLNQLDWDDVEERF